MPSSQRLRSLAITALLCSGIAVNLSLASPASATTLDATGATLRFGVTGQTITQLSDLDTPLASGSSILFSEAATVDGTAIDSRVTFVRGTNLGNSPNTPSGYIKRIDDARGSSVGAAYLEHTINRQTSGTPAMAEIRVDFYVAGTSTPVTLSNLTANFYDLDGNEAVEVEGLSTYTLSDNTHLTTTSASNGAVRFQAPGASTTTSSPILTAYTVGRAKASFTATSRVIYRLHMPASSSDFDFNVDFSAGQPWVDNGQNRAEIVSVASASLSPSRRTVSTVVNCPVSLEPLLASNFGGPVTYAVTSGTVPAGLTLNTTNGTFTGASPMTSSATVDITGTGSSSGTATAQVVFDVTNAALSLAPVSQSVIGTTGAWIDDTATPTVSHACGDVSYAITAGTLPAGLTLNPSTGVISGTPTAASSGTVTITATDTFGRNASTSVTFGIVAPPTTLDATGATFVFGVTGQNIQETSDLGTPRPAGTAITYRRVTTINSVALDAVVTFVDGENLGSLANNVPIGYIERIDASRGSGSTRPYIEHELRTTTSASSGWARLRVDFYLANTYSTPGSGLPVTLTNLVANFYDIDELQAVEVQGATSYSTSDNTHLTVTTVSAGALRFTAGPGQTFDSSPTLTAFTVGRAKVTFAPTSFITYRLFGPANDFHVFDVDVSAGRDWLDNSGGAEVVTQAPPSLALAAPTITGLRHCPISMTPPVASNFAGAVSYASTSGIAPPGLTFSTSTGVFAGTPTADSSATVDITATGSTSGSATTQVTFDITSPAMTLAPVTQSVTGSTGTAIAATSALTATNPCSSLTYAVTSGSLPPGLTLNPATGAITGTPTQGTSTTVTITATDTIDSSRTATATVALDITGPSAPAVLPPQLAPLVTAPVVAPTPSTTTPTTTPPTTTTPPSPTTTAPPAPVPAPQGGLPALGSTEVLVTENGEPVAVELVVENDEALVLRSQDFELRLRGNCTTGCTITNDTTGRETIHLDRNGAARVSGFGFLPGSLVHVWIFSEPHYLGALPVAADGTYDGPFPLDDIEVGGHTLQANGLSFDNVPRRANLGIIVIDAAATVPTPGPTALPATGTTNTTPIIWALALLTAGLTLVTTARRRRHA